MDFSMISELYMPIVMLACLIIGYCIKNLPCLKNLPNGYIPTILAILGAILGCVTKSVTLESAICGALTGLASTGLHQAFKNAIVPNGEDDA